MSEGKPKKKAAGKDGPVTGKRGRGRPPSTDKKENAGKHPLKIMICFQIISSRLQCEYVKSNSLKT